MVNVRRLLLLLFLPLTLHGQVHKFSAVEQLPYNVNSEVSEIIPMLSHDGKYLFFSRSIIESNRGGQFAGHDIWVSERTSSGWTRASNLFFDFNTKGNDAIIGVNKAGNAIYLMRTFPGKKVKGIYYSKRERGKWMQPELIPIEGIESSGSVGFYMHSEGEVLLISMQAPDSRGNEDLYICFKQKDGTWSKPKNMGTAINTSGFEISPYLSDDKRKLYFASSGHKGFGDADIYVTQRLYDSWETWTVPMNLGDQVNSKNFDAYFSIYGDTLAYYASSKGSKLANIFSAKVSIVEIDPDRKLVPLTDDEISELIGANVNRKFLFDRDRTALDAQQKELLWFIAHRLIGQHDVKILLLPSKQDPDEITGARINTMITQLANAGIEGSRVVRSATTVPEGNNPEAGEIHIILTR